MLASSRIVRTAGLVALALAAAALPGCLVGQGSSVEEHGTFVSQPTLANLGPGTRESDLIAALGEPGARSTMSDGAQMLKWTHRRIKSSGGYVFLIYAGGHSEEQVHTTYAIVRNGAVERIWQDGAKTEFDHEHDGDNCERCKD